MKELNRESMADLADEVLGVVLDVASGRIAAANERSGFRQIAIFTDGVTL